MIEKDEEILRVVEEVCVGGTLQKLDDIQDTDEKSTCVVSEELVEMYEVIAGMGLDMLHEKNVMVNTKYKTVDKKVKPAASPLPAYSEEKEKKFRRPVTSEVRGHRTHFYEKEKKFRRPSLRKSADIRHTFTKESVKKLCIGVEEFLLPKEKN